MTSDTLNPATMRDLYSETINPGKPANISGDLAKSILEDVGRNTGVMPVDNGLGVDPMDVPNEPRYVGPGSSLLREYVRPAFERIKEHYRSKEGAVPYLGKLVVSAEKLPSQVGIFLEKAGRGYRITMKIIGKVLGAYRPGTGKITVDPVTFSANDSESRHMAFRPENVKDVVTHETEHAIQDAAGTIGIYNRDDVEAEATLRTSAITGNSPRAYPKERVRYKGKFGNKWITDLGRYAKDVKAAYIDPIVDSLTQPSLVPAPVSSYRRC